MGGRGTTGKPGVGGWEPRGASDAFSVEGSTSYDFRGTRGCAVCH